MSSIKTLLCRAIALGTFALGLAACGPQYDRTEITPVRGQSSLGGEVSSRRLVVPEGLVVTAHIVAWNDDNEQMPLAVRSKNPDIVEVAGVVNERNYAFLGLRTGRTEIEVIADDTLVLTVEANVTAQPALP